MFSIFRIVNETSTWHNPPNLTTWHNPPHWGPGLLLDFSCLFSLSPTSKFNIIIATKCYNPSFKNLAMEVLQSWNKAIKNKHKARTLILLSLNETLKVGVSKCQISVDKMLRKNCVNHSQLTNFAQTSKNVHPLQILFQYHGLWSNWIKRQFVNDALFWFLYFCSFGQTNYCSVNLTSFLL